MLTIVFDDELLKLVEPYVDEIIPLQEHLPHPLSAYLRMLVENAHDRWLWSKVAQNNWELRDLRAKRNGKQIQRWFVKAASRVLANYPCLRVLTSLEQHLSWKLRRTHEYDKLFARLQPDLVFNGSHIHGLAGELPLRVAQRLNPF